MSEYIALARKWRPKSLDEFVGQQHIVSFFQNSFTKDKIHHAYLLSGTRGVGKTSLARIVAKSLCCENIIDHMACNKCRTCNDIDIFRHLDVIEVDAASKTKVEDTREILDNLDYMPSESKYKIYIIDEIHMLSKHSFNALLKSLEEPPEYVKFIFATTEPEKIPETIKSRCIHLKLSSINLSQIAEKLKSIAFKENIKIEDDALNLIALNANGSMRDALSLLEQCLLDSSTLTLAQVQKMLGVIDNKSLQKLLSYIVIKDIDNACNLAKSMILNGFDSMKIVDQMLEVIYDLIMKKALNEEVKNTALDVLKDLDENTLQQMYQVTLHSKEDIVVSPNQIMSINILIIRLIKFIPKKISLAPLPLDLETSDSVKEQKLDNASSEYSKDEDFTKAPLTKENVIKHEKTAAKKNKTNDLKNINSDDNKSMHDKWFNIYSKLDLQGVSKLVAKNSSLLSIEDNVWNFSINDNFINLASEQIIQNITTHIRKIIGNNKIVCNYISEKESSQKTPSAIILDKKNQEYENKKKEIAKNEVSAAILSKLDGKLLVKE